MKLELRKLLQMLGVLQPDPVFYIGGSDVLPQPLAPAQEQALLYQFYLYEGRKSNEKVTRQLADTNKRLEETRVGVGLGGEA